MNHNELNVKSKMDNYVFMTQNLNTKSFQIDCHKVLNRQNGKIQVSTTTGK